MAQCQESAAGAANEAATNALAEAIAEVQKCVEEEACWVEAEEAEAARRAEKEEEVCKVAEVNKTARCAKEEAKATRQADANTMATSSFPDMDFPMASVEQAFCLHHKTGHFLKTPQVERSLNQLAHPALPFSTLNASTAPPSPVMEEEDELLKDNVPLQLDLSTVTAGKHKVAPKPPTTFAPVSKHCKYFGGIEVIDFPGKVTPLPESTTPSVAASYHLHDHPTMSIPTLITCYTHSPQVTIMDPAEIKASKSSKALKGSSKAAGMKPMKCTSKEMPQLVSNEPINIELLMNNLLKQVEYAQNYIAVVCWLEDIAFLHSFDHLHAIHGISQGHYTDPQSHWTPVRVQ
ncbi:hypothetical protein BDQ17DRAFT_1435064 [Cyathus striatus]|nr:hypothetical protein BDQ17DRAFT_1435064 [Cyathus striatus]